MTVKEAAEYAKNMTYREAVYNALQGRAVPFKKASKIKLDELLEIADKADLEITTNAVLDKIRAEIEQLNYDDIAFIYRTRDVAEIKHKIYLEDVFQIIDKYKREGRNPND